MGISNPWILSSASPSDIGRTEVKGKLIRGKEEIDKLTNVIPVFFGSCWQFFPSFHQKDTGIANVSWAGLVEPGKNEKQKNHFITINKNNHAITVSEAQGKGFILKFWLSGMTINLGCFISAIWRPGLTFRKILFHVEIKDTVICHQEEAKKTQPHYLLLFVLFTLFSFKLQLQWLDWFDWRGRGNNPIPWV